MTIFGVVFQPEVYQEMHRGINQLVDAIRPTLGPHPRIVAVERIAQRYKAPELLDDGGLIARRLIELPNRKADIGAMYLRHLLWQVRETVGDGTATTAVLFQSIFNSGVRYITAGGNAMVLRHHLEAGLQLILDTLDQMAMPLGGQEKLTQMAESVCYDPPLAKTLGEIFNLIGEHGRLEIRTGHGREIEREFIEGSYWDSGPLIPTSSAHAATSTARMITPFIFISNLPFDDPQTTLHCLTTAKQAGASSVLLIGKQISETVAGMLHQINRQTDAFQVITAKTPGKTATDETEALIDIALLTGGRLFLKDAGDSMMSVKPEDFGKARRAWVDRNHLGLVRGQGNPAKLRDHIKKLQMAVNNTTKAKMRKNLQLRVGRLLGGAAALWVGAATESEIKSRKTLAQRTADALRGAIQQGIVPGGGVALLNCRPVLAEKLSQSNSLDEQNAYRILCTAMEAPLQTIAGNAGYEAGAIIAQLNRNGNGFGFDVRSGKIVDMAQAGIWDATAVVKTAVQGAVSAAALALTTDVFVLHKNRVQAGEP